MKSHHNDEEVEEFALGEIHKRPSEMISLRIPSDTLRSIEKVAASREMTVDGLLKFYIGQCLRLDMDRLFANRLLAATTDVLRERLASDDEVAEIMESIQKELSHPM